MHNHKLNHTHDFPDHHSGLSVSLAKVANLDGWLGGGAIFSLLLNKAGTLKRGRFNELADGKSTN